MAPLHHHFELALGERERAKRVSIEGEGAACAIDAQRRREVRVVVGFWIVQGLLSVLAAAASFLM